MLRVPRPARFSDDDVLDAALACVARGGGEVTIQQVSAELGGPIGSIYHRFASREVLLARLWLRSVRRFQAGVLPLAEHGDPHQALLEIALHVPRYCRDHPDEARSLTLHRQDRLLADCPPGLEDDVAELNTELLRVSKTLTRRRYGNAQRPALTLVAMATRAGPYGFVRPYLGQAVPAVVDDVVAASSDAILRLGDRSS